MINPYYFIYVDGFCVGINPYEEPLIEDQEEEEEYE